MKQYFKSLCGNIIFPSLAFKILLQHSWNLILKDLSLCLKFWFSNPSLQPTVVDLRYFKLWTILDQIIEVWNFKGLHQQVVEIWVLENLNLWQRLNSFIFSWSGPFNFSTSHIKHKFDPGVLALWQEFVKAGESVELRLWSRGGEECFSFP